MESVSHRGVGNPLRGWWRAPSDYAQRIEYLSRRRVISLMRMLLGAGTFAWAAGSVAMQFSASGPQSTVGRTITGLAAVLAVGWALAWIVLPWPTWQRGLAFAVCADLAPLIVGFQTDTNFGGFYAIVSTSTISMFIAICYEAKALSVQGGYALAVIILVAGRALIDPHGDIYVAATQVLLAVVMATSPVVVNLVMWVMMNEASESVTDPLTGILNRRGLSMRLIGVMRQHKPDVVLVVMVADIDLFKSVNDTHGHGIGDEVLVRCTTRIGSVLGSDALFARIGGEEFAVVEAADRESAIGIAERIRAVVNVPDDAVPVTASVGVTTVEVASMRHSTERAVVELESALTRADRALLEAKRNGRNRTIYLPHAEPRSA